MICSLGRLHIHSAESVLRRLAQRHVYICAVMAIPSRTSQARMTTPLSMLGAECHGHSDVLFIAFGPSTRSIRICPNILGLAQAFFQAFLQAYLPRLYSITGLCVSMLTSESSADQSGRRTLILWTVNIS